jgi:hypothetical protein
MSNIILHHFQGNQIGLRYLDCYINATAMSTAHKEKTGKRRDVTDWSLFSKGAAHGKVLVPDQGNNLKLLP